MRDKLAKMITKKTKTVVMRLYIKDGYWWASTVNGDVMVSDMLRGSL